MIEVSKRQQKNERIVKEFWQEFNDVKAAVDADPNKEFTFTALYTKIAKNLSLKPMGVRTALARNGLITEWKEWKEQLKLSQAN